MCTVHRTVWMEKGLQHIFQEIFSNFKVWLIKSLEKFMDISLCGRQQEVGFYSFARIGYPNQLDSTLILRDQGSKLTWIDPSWLNLILKLKRYIRLQHKNLHVTLIPNVVWQGSVIIRTRSHKPHQGLMRQIHRSHITAKLPLAARP